MGYACLGWTQLWFGGERMNDGFDGERRYERVFIDIYCFAGDPSTKCIGILFSKIMSTW